MPVLGLLSYCLEVPSLDEAIEFYTAAGFEVANDGKVARFRCPGQTRDSIILLGGFSRKRLHHVTLRADGLDEIARTVVDAGGRNADAPEGFDDNGLWIEDPHGVLYHIIDCPADSELEAAPLFEINAPGRLVRTGRSAIKPIGTYPPVVPRRLGHVLMFSPDVAASVRFVTDCLGMALADRSEDIIAFTCASRNSDHHVLAFAKSPGIGFHHGSFQVNDPDEVGRGGRALIAKTQRGDWGFGRHTIGSNYFHYIQDPWGSWFEYYSDMDYIEDAATWQATNYRPEDALDNWGPAVPHDFVHNYEMDPVDA